MLGAASMVGGLQAATQFFAHTFAYHATLGPNVGHVYAPWSILHWTYKWYSQYPDEIMKAGSMGMLVSTVGLLGVAVAKVVTSNSSKANEYLHGSARWADIVLAATTTVILLLLCTPLAWWLAHTHSRWRHVVGAVVALPLVLPPTVIGFYLLVAMGPAGPLGQFTQAMGWGLLSFTFTGLVIGSVIYSMPFVVQPLQNAFEAIGERPLEVAAALGAGPLDRFFTVALPLARPAVAAGVALVLKNKALPIAIKLGLHHTQINCKIGKNALILYRCIKP